MKTKRAIAGSVSETNISNLTNKFKGGVFLEQLKGSLDRLEIKCNVGINSSTMGYDWNFLNRTNRFLDHSTRLISLF